MRRNAILLGGATVVIALVGAALIHQQHEATSKSAAVKGTPSYWYDPMHPQEHFDKAGKSPFMDMQLVPKYADADLSTVGSTSTAGSATPASIAIDSRVVENLGVRLAKVEQESFSRVVDTVGQVGVDEEGIEAVQVRQSGWVERLDVRAAGDAVRRGQLLAGVYSPDLLATEQELIIARDSGDPTLLEAARRRLSLFGLSDAQIARVESSGQVERRIDYYAPIDGYVMTLGVRQGEAVQPGSTLFQLVDLNRLWIAAEVPETQAAWIEPGDRVDIEVPARPGEYFAGKVNYLYPELTGATRTLKVRVVVRNPDRRLRPGMFATAHFHTGAQQPMLTVPTESVIKTGTRSVIIVADDATHFRPVPVQVGTEQGGRSEILQGLTLGESIVASGQFLIDSEANLRGAFDNLAGSNGLMPAPSGQSPAGAH